MIFKRSQPFGPALLAFGLGLAGCVMPGAEKIVGPDGTPMLHVHCGGDQSQCFRLAGESCPYGYEYAPVYDPKDGNFFVRCRSQLPAVAAVPTILTAPVAQAPAPVTTYTAPSNSPPAPATSASASGDWPPGEVGRATEPWNKEPSTVVSSSAPPSGLPPTPRTKLGEVDVGY